MKIFSTLILSLVLSLSAYAYNSAPSGDVGQGFRDVEYKTVKKVDGVTGYDDAVSKGHGLFYEDGAGSPDGLYKVSRNYSGTPNTAAASLVSACIAAKDVATGDVGGFPCVTKGYVDYAIYTVATGNAIGIGTYMCVNDAATARGYLVGCGSGITSPFVALEAKAENTSGTIKISVNSR